MKDQSIFSQVINLLILITKSLYNQWIWLGENCCWSPLGLKELTKWGKCLSQSHTVYITYQGKSKLTKKKTG